MEPFGNGPLPCTIRARLLCRPASELQVLPAYSISTAPPNGKLPYIAFRVETTLVAIFNIFLAIMVSTSRFGAQTSTRDDARGRQLQQAAGSSRAHFYDRSHVSASCVAENHTSEKIDLFMKTALVA